MARPRLPSYLKVVRGTVQKCRMNEAEPAPGRARPSPPPHLSEAEKVAWHEVALLADQLRVLAATDALGLESAAGALSDLRAARASLALPLVLIGDDGTPVIVAKAGERSYGSGPLRRARPEIADIADAERRLGTWLARFGLSPADRSRVSAAPPDIANPFANIG